MALFESIFYVSNYVNAEGSAAGFPEDGERFSQSGD